MYAKDSSTLIWFDKEAGEAAKFYTSLFSNSKIKNTTIIHDTPSGDAETVTIELSGQEFVLLSAGPYLKFNSSISFLVACEICSRWCSPIGGLLV